MTKIYIENESFTVVLKNKKINYVIDIHGIPTQVKQGNSTQIYFPLDNLYTHTGTDECIFYYTISQEGQMLVINRFNSVIPNVGIKRNNGTKG